MKKTILVLSLLIIASVSCFAGAPAPTTERPVPVEKVTPPPPPPPAPSTKGGTPLVITRHFTLGLGLGGSPIIGFDDKDNYGYPRDEFGLCTGFGFAMTWFKGQPTAEDVNAAEARVKKNNPGIADKDVPSAVRTELGVNSLSYVGLGVINAEMGNEWILSDNVRTRLGIGLPTLISFGINFDF